MDNSGGSNYWYRGFIAFDIDLANRPVPVFSADLNVMIKDETRFGSNSCNFDLNSINDIDTNSGITTDDWDSIVFYKAVDNYLSVPDVVPGESVSGDVVEAWNNAFDNSRGYLHFRVGMDNEDQKTGGTDECNLEICDTGETDGVCFSGLTDPEIEYVLKPFVDIVSSDIPMNVAIGDENSVIDFNIFSADTNHVYADIYYSENKGGFENLIVRDLNLFHIGNVLNASVDANCDSNNFSLDYVLCSWDFNHGSVSDGNWFVDLNIHYDVAGSLNPDVNSVDYSDESFLVDRTIPFTSWDGNHSIWQFMDANITLTCVDDTSGCSSIEYQFDTDASLFKDWSNAVTVSTSSTTDLNLPVAGDNDGNYFVRFRSTDNLSNSQSDWNSFVVLIDRKAPHSPSFSPDENSTGSDSTPTFTANFSDSNEYSDSSVSSCGYRVYVNEVFYSYGTVSVDPDGLCSYTLDSSLADGQSAYVDWNGVDSAGNVSGYYKGFSSAYSAPAEGEGSGGGGITVRRELVSVTVPSLVNIFPSTSVLYLAPGEQAEYKLVIESLSDQDMNLSIDLPESLQPFMIQGVKQGLLLSKESVVWKWLVSIPEDQDFSKTVDGNISIIIADQETVSVPLILQPQEFDLAGIRFFDLPLTLFAGIVIVVSGVYVGLNPPKKGDGYIKTIRKVVVS